MATPRASTAAGTTATRTTNWEKRNGRTPRSRGQRPGHLEAVAVIRWHPAESRHELSLTRRVRRCLGLGTPSLKTQIPVPAYPTSLTLEKRRVKTPDLGRWVSAARPFRGFGARDSRRLPPRRPLPRRSFPTLADASVAMVDWSGSLCGPPSPPTIGKQADGTGTEEGERAWLGRPLDLKAGRGMKSGEQRSIHDRARSRVLPDRDRI